MSNQITFKEEARKNLMEGVELVHKSVSTTLGASGRNSVFNRWNGKPVMSNDGASIAREVDPVNLAHKQGADLVKQVLDEVNEEAGDATTTTEVVYHAMLEKGLELIGREVDPVNPIRLRRQMKEATKKVVDALTASAISVETIEDLEKIATTSAESPEIGKTIAQAVHDAGENGIVYVQESNKVGVNLEKTDGYQFHQGMISPYLMTNFERMESTLNNAAVLITDAQLHLNEDFIKLVASITQKTKDMLIICDEIHPDVIKFAVANLAKGNFNMAIVKKPMQAEFLEDIAALVGAMAVTANKGKTKLMPQYLGEAKKIVITQKTTTIFDGVNGERFIDGVKIPSAEMYISDLTKQLENSTDEVTTAKLQERIARLTGGVYVLEVGAQTPAEQRHLKDKVDDALNAAKKAKEGYVAGGGVALKNIIKSLSRETDGDDVIFYACLQPIRQIIENAGENVDEILSEIESNGGEFAGYDALALEVSPNMIDSGITDSLKSTIAALTISSNHAGLFLTTETLFTPIPEFEEKNRHLQ